MYIARQLEYLIGMEYNKIISVTGMSGLYELVTSKNDGAVVKSLEDGSTKFASTRLHNFSHLESIEVYTVRDNVNLVEIFQAIEKNSNNLPDEKDAAAVKAYFQKTYPDLDFDRVYNSDMKKMIKWYKILKAHQIEIKLTDVAEEAEATAPEVEEPAPKTAKKTKKKSASAE